MMIKGSPLLMLLLLGIVGAGATVVILFTFAPYTASIQTYGITSAIAIDAGLHTNYVEKTHTTHILQPQMYKTGSTTPFTGADAHEMMVAVDGTMVLKTTDKIRVDVTLLNGATPPTGWQLTARIVDFWRDGSTPEIAIIKTLMVSGDDVGKYFYIDYADKDLIKWENIGVAGTPHVLGSGNCILLSFNGLPSAYSTTPQLLTLTAQVKLGVETS